jgi:hypothetical protein
MDNFYDNIDANRPLCRSRTQSPRSMSLYQDDKDEENMDADVSKDMTVEHDEAIAASSVIIRAFYIRCVSVYYCRT